MKRSFPKTVINNYLDSPAEYRVDENKIVINKNMIKQIYVYWRRQILVAWCHEFCHFIYAKLYPYSSDCNNLDLIERYKDELFAYKMQRFVEKLLLLEPDWPTPEEGAVASLAVSIRAIIDYYEKEQQCVSSI